MPSRNQQLRVVEDEPDWELLPPRESLPQVPGVRERMELIELERQTRKATLYLKSVPGLIETACAIIQETCNSDNYLRVRASPSSVLVQSVTPWRQRVEDSIEIDMPDFGYG